MSRTVKLPSSITSDNPYYGVAGKLENCTAWATQVCKENSGKWYPQNRSGRACVGGPVKGNPKNVTMWAADNGFSKHYIRKNVLVGQFAIFDNGGTGHVEVVIAVDKKKGTFTTTSNNYGENNGAERFVHSMEAKSPHPVYKGLTLLGFRGTPMSYKFSL